MISKLPVIGICMGDYNGVGPEVIIKALRDIAITHSCVPIIYGSSKIFSFYRKTLDIQDFSYTKISSADQYVPRKINLINCGTEDVFAEPGVDAPLAGRTAYAALEACVADLKAGLIDGMVTAPINKSNIQHEDFKFPGHTEYLTGRFGCNDSLMMMVSSRLRVGVATGHVPLAGVPAMLTKELIVNKLKMAEKSLVNDFNIRKPRLAVLGLNPHAGDSGLLGTEDAGVITDAINEMKSGGTIVVGPFPADGFFGAGTFAKYDFVLAMYHDQGLIPFKTIAMEEGINFTAGLPVIRTSPDHGTAYNIAGKNMADETSMRQAIFTCIDLIKNRKELAELEHNALKSKK